MGIFDNLSQAQVFENSKYFQPGRYIVEITQCKFNVGGYKGDSFIIECKVIAAISEHPDAPKVGETAAQGWNASGEKRDIARNTWLGFLCRVYNCQKEDYNDAQWKKISTKVIDENKLAGTRMYLEIFMKKTKKGGDFTQHAWRGIATAKHYKEFNMQPPRKAEG